MLKRELDDYERYDVNKKITKELFGDSEEYIKTKIFDSLCCSVKANECT